MVTAEERQAIIDEEHLKLLPIGYWVLGAMDMFMAGFGLIYVAYGVLIAALPTGAAEYGDEVGLQVFSGIMLAIGAGFILGFGITAALKILAGFWIRKRKHHTATLVVAVIAGLTTLGGGAMMMPFGILIAVATFLVLQRPSVLPRYESAPRVEPAVPSEETS